MIPLPENFTKRMKTLLGDDYALYEKAMSQPPVRAFRVNTEKISVCDFMKINDLGDVKIPYVDTGFYLQTDKIGTHPLHHAGAVYVQEPAAMLPAECVDIQKGWCVLDMCASPGGKSTQMKCKIGKDGVLVSNEIVLSRCKILTGNIERMGAENTVTTCLDTKQLCEFFPHTFDLVMVDAPCSGEGMFRKDENARNEWSEESVTHCAKRQQQILSNAALCVKSGGYIVYSTCTFSIEENEAVVASFLKSHPDFVLVPVTERVEKATVPGVAFDGCECEDIHLARRFYPHTGKGEGQFMAVMKNTGEPFSVPKVQSSLKKCTQKEVFDFLDDVLVCYDKDRVFMHKDTPVYFTQSFPVPKGVAFSCGVNIGEVKKGYILPHHQFFMAMGKYFRRKITLSKDSTQIEKYLRGEAFDTDCPKGFAVVLVENCAVGGVKVVDGRIKNHYPKGLRRV